MTLVCGLSMIIISINPYLIQLVSGINYTTDMHSCNPNALYIRQDVEKISDGCLSIITDAVTHAC